MQYPYVYSLERIEIVFESSTCKYRLSYQRAIRNVGDEPLQLTSAKVQATMFPDDPVLTRHYYRLHPICFKKVDFIAKDESGSILHYQPITQSDNQTELDILFKDVSTGKALPVYKGEERTIFYSYQVSDKYWGPYFERKVSIPCEQVMITLRFPKGLVEVWGELVTSGGVSRAIEPPILKETNANEDIFTWIQNRPDMLWQYRLHWRFKDGRYLKLKEQVQQQLGDEVPINNKVAKHTEDFRYVYWYGRNFQFSPAQADVVRMLWKAYFDQTPEISQSYILKHLPYRSNRLRDLFSKHVAWKTWIVRGHAKGTYRLRSPDEMVDNL